jgi:hypothetical protein
VSSPHVSILSPRCIKLGDIHHLQLEDAFLATCSSSMMPSTSTTTTLSTPAYLPC